ncbi:glutamate-cysteine ligase family protein, partial [Nocardia brasiliensis]|uniref:glutamate-cysteine ligase family protein n=1 Tax=Nocardia brasiliensis TaxID=37326 RepID=UPI003D771A29
MKCAAGGAGEGARAPRPPAGGPRQFGQHEFAVGLGVTPDTACGAHVHIGVADPERAVAVVNHLRPWLPTLDAVGGNSPFHRGPPTG